jgi:hypothetical protein
MYKFAIILISVILLASCSKKEEANEPYFETTRRSTIKQATIEVNWLPNEAAVSKKCLSLGTNDGPPDSVPTYNGCARTKPTDVSVCEVYVVEPKDFDDKETLQVFGHEVWHCFGARHK